MFLMIASPSVLISSEEFKLFHEMDRKLYTLLTMDLCRDPLESMNIMALWLWLERSAVNKVIQRILSLPQFLINELADEAVTCLNYLKYAKPLLCLSEPTEIPLTRNLMDNEVTLQYFHENRLTVIHGVARIITEVCVRALTDIMQQAIEERNDVQCLAETKVQTSSLIQPGFVQLRIGGVDNIIKPGTKVQEVHPDDRTMFATFSKGYPVTETEIRELFTRISGDCIESLHMQDVKPGEQSLFARIVFHSLSPFESILNGVEKAKFMINGKHVWMRKFVPKNRGYSLPPLLPRPDVPARHLLSS